MALVDLPFCKVLEDTTHLATSDRHHCFKSGNIPKTEDGILMISMKFDGPKKIQLERKYFTGSIPLLTLPTVLRHVLVPWLSPLPQFLRNVVEILAQEGRNATS